MTKPNAEGQFNDTVELLPRTAEALNDLVCYVGRVNVSMENMAWLALVARELPDTERFFPHGKWATIQHIEAQLQRAAKCTVASLGKENTE